MRHMKEMELARAVLEFQSRMAAIEALAHRCPCCGRIEAPVGENKDWVHLEDKP